MDSKQLEQVIDQYMIPIYRYCVMYLKNHHDAQDCTQDTFIKFSQSDVSGDVYIKNWLYQVARNECVSHMRRHWYRTHLDSELIEMMPSTEMKEDLTLILNAPQKFREVLYLYYYEGYSQAEISNMLNISVDAVKKRMVRGRESIRLCMEGDCHE